MAEPDRGGCANKKNAHGSIGPIHTFPTLILSRLDRFKEKHHDHPGETMEAAVVVADETIFISFKYLNMHRGKLPQEMQYA